MHSIFNTSRKSAHAFKSTAIKIENCVIFNLAQILIRTPEPNTNVWKTIWITSIRSNRIEFEMAYSYTRPILAQLSEIRLQWNCPKNIILTNSWSRRRIYVRSVSFFFFFFFLLWCTLICMHLATFISIYIYIILSVKRAYMRDQLKWPPIVYHYS